MPIPRYEDEKGRYEIVLFCPKCAYAVVKDSYTENRTECPLCGGDLETRRVDYPGRTPSTQALSTQDGISR